MDPLTAALFVLIGLLGGITHSFLLARNWSELRQLSFAKSVWAGAVAGLLFYLIHSQWTVPNGIVCFFAGWWGRMFLMSLAKRFKPRSDERCL